MTAVYDMNAFIAMLPGASVIYVTLPTKEIYLIFQPLQFVSRYRDPQLQVVENYSYLCNLSTNIGKSW